MDSRYEYSSSFPKPTGSQKELFDESKKERQQPWFKVSSSTNGGIVRWNVMATCATCTTRWPVARITAYEKICGVPSGILMGRAFRAGGGCSGYLLIEDCEHLENLSPSDSHVKQFKHQDAQGRNAVDPMCRRTSQTLRSSSTLHTANCPPVETPSKMKKQRTPFSKKETMNTIGA